MAKNYLVGIDAGTSGVRAACFDIEGHCVASGAHSYDPYFNTDGTAYYRIKEVQDALIAAIKQMLESGNIDPNAIAGISAGIIGVLLTGYGKEGKTVTDCIYFSDRRYTSHLDDAYRAFEAAGISKADYHNIAFILPRHISALMAIRKNEPDLFKKVDRWCLSFQPFIFGALGGRTDVEPEDHTAYCNLYNSYKHEFDQALCNAAGIPPETFAAPSYTGSPCGFVSKEGAQKTGLAENTPLFTGANDQLAQILAQGAINESDMALNLGSAACFNRLTRKPVVKYDPNIGVLGGGDNKTVRVVGNCGYFGAAYVWIRDNIAFGMLKNEAEKIVEKNLFSYMNERAAQSPMGSNGVMFMPYFFSRGDCYSAKASFLGITPVTTTADMIRSVLECTVYETKIGIDLEDSVTGIKSEKIFVTGGPSESRFWMQIMADVLGTKLYKSEGDSNLTGCKGAAMFAGIGAGKYTGFKDAVGKAVREPSVIEPIPEHTAFYQNICRDYKRMADALCFKVYE